MIFYKEGTRENRDMLRNRRSIQRHCQKWEETRFSERRSRSDEASNSDAMPNVENQDHFGTATGFQASQISIAVENDVCLPYICDKLGFYW